MAQWEIKELKALSDQKDLLVLLVKKATKDFGEIKEN